MIEWKTASEIDTAGFRVWRSDSAAGDYVKVHETLIASDGSPVQGAPYALTDWNCLDADCFYKLEDVDYDGVSTFHGPIGVEPTSSVCGTSTSSGGINHAMWFLVPVIMLAWRMRRKGRSKAA